ncbi:GEVED domain-containing protein, partial [Chloroflexota bacterium]
MHIKRSLFIGGGVLLVLTIAVGLVFASDASPAEEPASSPYFEATLQQAVDELDGKARVRGTLRAAQSKPAQYYTADPNIWDACEFGFTQDLIRWPGCHYTSDPNNVNWSCGSQDPPWPTQDFTWDSRLWPQYCGTDITQDPGFWCDLRWTNDPEIIQCRPEYTSVSQEPIWCQPRYTWDPARWPRCPNEPPYYTESPDLWPECDPAELTSDPYRWPQCHFTSDPRLPDCVENPYPTQDYTSNPLLWSECDPQFTWDPSVYPCEDRQAYTQDPMWPWCEDPRYTLDPVQWPWCHFTSDPNEWPDACERPYPTRDFTWDSGLWPQQCGSRVTYDEAFWCAVEYTQEPARWPWCDPAWTWDPGRWPACEPGYTNDPDTWPLCGEGLYTEEPAAWAECSFYTGDARVWPECHYTSDPNLAECDGTWFPTKDFTTDTHLWSDCEPGYTTDPAVWPECRFTSDPQVWPECQPPELGDLGDAPDSTNHSPAAPMTAYPAGGPPGVPAWYPTVFDPATGFPPGPKHWNPRADAWLGQWVTLENDADLLPDEDPTTNLDPPGDKPDLDDADDGVQFPLPALHCTPSVFTYTVTITATAPVARRFVNVWFDWNRDGDWADVLECPTGAPAPEWAVQDHVVTLGPGTHVLSTPLYLPWNPPEIDIPEIWMRISIAEGPAPTIPGSDRADGRGSPNGYMYGETEDYYFVPECPLPDAEFVWDPTTICTDTIVSFFDTSTSTLPLLSWSWDFGDSLGTSSFQN